jgi:peptidyl-prolyl cis-trans isomerase SurA
LQNGAREASEDPSVNQNGGDLGYFITAFSMVYTCFETAAYATPVGKIFECNTAPVFGYHE